MWTNEDTAEGGIAIIANPMMAQPGINPLYRVINYLDN